MDLWRSHSRKRVGDSGAFFGMSLVVDRKRSWSSRRDWPAVDGRFRYVGRRSTAVRKGRAGRSSDLVRAKPRPTRKTFRDVGTGSFLSSGETATIPKCRLSIRFLRPRSNFQKIPRASPLPDLFHVFFSSKLITNRERDKFFFFSFFLPFLPVSRYFPLTKKKRNNLFSSDYRSRDKREK